MGELCEKQHISDGVNMKKYDIIVIGAGPAGISSAIYAKRAGASVCVFDSGEGRLEQAKKIENYYGFLSISGKKLKKDGIKQAQNLGVDVFFSPVDFVENDFENQKFLVKAGGENFQSKAIVIACGQKTQNIDKRLEKFKNKNISSCAICDGFFYKNKTVGVLGNKTYAKEEAEILSNVAKNVLIFTDGETELKNSKNIQVISKKIVDFVGKEKLEEVVLEDQTVKIDGLFLALENMGAIDLANKLGILVKNQNIVVNEKCETNVKGIYSAGDVTNSVKQVATAVYQGMIAGLESSKFVKN